MQVSKTTPQYHREVNTKLTNHGVIRILIKCQKFRIIESVKQTNNFKSKIQKQMSSEPQVDRQRTACEGCTWLVDS
jgi:hypothetical protein